MSGAKFDVKGESLNEERNQEKGAREKEGCPEEEKVARALYKSEFQIHGPEQSGPFFICAPSGRAASSKNRRRSGLRKCSSWLNVRL
jgi:hypothetical protein